jgi:hypothetical protein
VKMGAFVGFHGWQGETAEVSSEHAMIGKEHTSHDPR